MYLLVRAHLTKLHRAHQTAIFRIRTHDAPLNAHLHRIKKEHPAKCVYCPDSDETIEHVLFHCPLYDDIRSRLLPAQPMIHWSPLFLCCRPSSVERPPAPQLNSSVMPTPVKECQSFPSFKAKLKTHLFRQAFRDLV